MTPLKNAESVMDFIHTRLDHATGMQWITLKDMSKATGLAPSTCMLITHRLRAEGQIQIHKGPGNSLGYTLGTREDEGSA